MWQGLLEVILFILCIVFCFYLPGKFLLWKLRIQLPTLETVFLAIISGMLAFTFLCYIFSWIHLQAVVLLILAVMDYLVITARMYGLQPLEKRHRLPLLLIGVFSVIFSFPLLLLGIYGKKIVYGFDDLWHLSLIQELKNNFPPGIPTYADVHLRGYHFFYNFLLTQISNFFFISPFSLHFHLFPVLSALLWGLGVYLLMLLWSKKVSTSLFAVFLTMFGGSFAYILHWQGHSAVSPSDGLGMLQPAVSIYNPPFSISVVFLLFAILVLYQYLQTKEKRWMLLFVLAAGLLPMFKVYAGIILYGGFLFVAFCELLRKKIFLLGILLMIGLLFWGTYWIFVGGTGSLLWHPFWPPHELLRTFSWYGYDEKIYTFTHLHVLHGLIETEVYGFFLFLIGNLGTRILGIIALPLLLLKKRKLPSIFALSLLVMLLISVLVPLLFLQTGKVFEIIQMASYYLLFCSIFAALGFSAFFSLRIPFHNIIVSVMIVLIVVFTVPSAWFSYNGVIAHAMQPVSLEQPYYQALAFLRARGTYNQTVLELPPLANSSNLAGLSYWYGISSPAVAVFADKRTYFNPTGIDFPGMDHTARIKTLLLLSAYRESPTTDMKQKLIDTFKRDHIVYLFGTYQIASLTQIPGIHEIYNQYGYVIYQIADGKSL